MFLYFQLGKFKFTGCILSYIDRDSDQRLSLKKENSICYDHNRNCGCFFDKGEIRNDIDYYSHVAIIF